VFKGHLDEVHKKILDSHSHLTLSWTVVKNMCEHIADNPETLTGYRLFGKPLHLRVPTPVLSTVAVELMDELETFMGKLDVKHKRGPDKTACRKVLVKTLSPVVYFQLAVHLDRNVKNGIPQGNVDAGLTPRLPLNTALLVFNAGLFRSQKIWNILPHVGIDINLPQSDTFASDIKAALSQYVDAYYNDEPGEGRKLNRIVCAKAWENLDKVGIRKLHDRSGGGVGAPYGSTGSAAAAAASLTSIEKALRGYKLNSIEKGEAAAALKQPLAAPPRKNGAEQGTLQPPALGLSCAHRLVLC
jgi:hypothetical protein